MSAIAAQHAAVDAREAELQRRLAALAALERGQQSAERVQLFVGGVSFSTTRAVLCAAEEPGAVPSMLAAMLSPQWPVQGDAIHIDRDPSPFAHILTFLRTGELPPPGARESVAREADFYGLVKLLDLLKPARFETLLDGANLRILEEENTVRAGFGPFAGAAPPAESLLIDVFAQPPWLTELSVFPGHETLQLLFSKERLKGRVEGAAATCTLLDFEKNWAYFAELPAGVLAMPGVVAAGGAVLAALIPRPNRRAFRGQALVDEPTHDAILKAFYKVGASWFGRFDRRNCFRTSDVDLFLVGLSETEALQTLMRIRFALGDSVKAMTRTNTTVSFARQDADGRILRTVQVILRLCRSTTEVLTGFDLDCCCVAFDGERVVALPRARRAIKHSFNVAGADASRESYNFEVRLLKYACRGWAVACPLAAGWRSLVDPRVFAAEREPSPPGCPFPFPTESAPREGSFALVGFAKLVAWEAAMGRGEVRGLRDFAPHSSGASSAEGTETKLRVFEYGVLLPFELLPWSEERPGRRLDAIASLMHCAANTPAHFVFVSCGWCDPNFGWRRLTLPGDIDALLDLQAHVGRALMCSGDTNYNNMDSDLSTWTHNYFTTVPVRVAFVGHSLGQRWPYTGAPAGGDPSIWFSHAWRT